ncbi:MAG: hypothetical protein AAFY19_05685, partial [Pseudomonadota bacterium]
LGKLVEQFKISDTLGRSSTPSVSAQTPQPPRVVSRSVKPARSSQTLESVGNLALKPDASAAALEDEDSQDWSEF